MTIRNRIVSVIALLIVIYAMLPLLAGAFEIGDKWGPKVYPVGYHSAMYVTGWEMTEHREEGKPRMHPNATLDMRPGFYWCGPSASEVVKLRGLYLINRDAE